MSHMAKIKGQIKNLEALKRASSKLGLAFIENATSARYYANNTVKCSHKITMPNTSYEIGVVKEKDDTYGLQTDFYDANVTKAIGRDGVKLRDSYNEEVTRMFAESTGKSVFRETEEDGTVVLRLRAF